MEENILCYFIMYIQEHNIFAKIIAYEIEECNNICGRAYPARPDIEDMD